MLLVSTNPTTWLGNSQTDVSFFPVTSHQRTLALKKKEKRDEIKTQNNNLLLLVHPQSSTLSLQHITQSKEIDPSHHILLKIITTMITIHSLNWSLILLIINTLSLIRYPHGTHSFTLVTNNSKNTLTSFLEFTNNSYITRQKRRRWSHINMNLDDQEDTMKNNNNKQETNEISSSAPFLKMSDQIIQAAADLTTSTSSLLNIKSIGVDYGLVRTGIAVSNGGYNPQPLSIISNLNNTQLCNKIVNLVQSENAHQIVMGLPFHKNGTEAEQTIITRNFASTLNCAVCAHFGFDRIPVYLWDERYTSKEAESRIRAANPRAGLLYKDLDADAASIILEYYYSENGVGAERVQLPDNDEIRNVVHQAWLKRKEEKEREILAIREQRMNAGDRKQELIEKAKLLDAQLALERGDSNVASSKKGKKKKKKKEKKKRIWTNLSTNMGSNTNE